MEQETVWLTQDQMAALFGRDKSVISRHIKRIFETEDQEKDWVKVLYEVILKILTLGFYHVEKHRKDKWRDPWHWSAEHWTKMSDSIRRKQQRKFNLNPSYGARLKKTETKWQK